MELLWLCSKWDKFLEKNFTEKNKHSLSFYNIDIIGKSFYIMEVYKMNNSTKFLICSVCRNIVGVIEDKGPKLVCCGKKWMG